MRITLTVVAVYLTGALVGAITGALDLLNANTRAELRTKGYPLWAWPTVYAVAWPYILRPHLRKS